MVDDFGTLASKTLKIENRYGPLLLTHTGWSAAHYVSVIIVAKKLAMGNTFTFIKSKTSLVVATL